MNFIASTLFTEAQWRFKTGPQRWSGIVRASAVASGVRADRHPVIVAILFGSLRLTFGLTMGRYNYRVEHEQIYNAWLRLIPTESRGSDESVLRVPAGL